MPHRINRRIVCCNIAEAREQLEELDAALRDPRQRSDALLEVALGHAYHHLDCAWHVRRVPTRRYAHLSTADFNRWGEFPDAVWLPRIERAEGRNRPAGRSSRQKSRSGRRR